MFLGFVMFGLLYLAISSPHSGVTLQVKTSQTMMTNQMSALHVQHIEAGRTSFVREMPSPLCG